MEVRCRGMRTGVDCERGHVQTRRNSRGGVTDEQQKIVRGRLGGNLRLNVRDHVQIRRPERHPWLFLGGHQLRMHAVHAELEQGRTGGGRRDGACEIRIEPLDPSSDQVRLHHLGDALQQGGIDGRIGAAPRICPPKLELDDVAACGPDLVGRETGGGAHVGGVLEDASGEVGGVLSEDRFGDGDRRRVFGFWHGDGERLGLDSGMKRGVGVRGSFRHIMRPSPAAGELEHEERDEFEQGEPSSWPGPHTHDGTQRMDDKVSVLYFERKTGGSCSPPLAVVAPMFITECTPQGRVH